VRRRGRLAALLGAVALVASWLFGSIPLAPVGAGLVAAGALALGWRRLSVAGARLERHAPRHLLEGDSLRLELRLGAARAPFGRATAIERVGVLGEHPVTLRRGRGVLALDRLPRGLYVLGPGTLVLEDPLGLERTTMALDETAHLAVRPRVVPLLRPFVGSDGVSSGGRNRPLRSPSGLEPHGIREYREGEPLRAVHWPSTARRGELMVRELDDPSGDQVVVVLDGDAAGDVGPRGASSFDEAVRAAASIAASVAGRGRRVRLVVHGARTRTFRFGSTGRDWDAALDGLAAAEADATAPVHSILGGSRNAVTGATETVVVTARPSLALTRRLGRLPGAALVVVDAPTYVGSARSEPDPSLLRLVASRVPVVVLRCGDDLAASLGGYSREQLGA
jgi:uncharacterized protein (DUF58 family)